MALAEFRQTSAGKWCLHAVRVQTSDGLEQA
jgi:hypothetical protein